MDHVTFIPTVDQLNYTFGGAPPVLADRPGTVLTLWTEDAYGGRITSQDDVASVALDTEDLNPQTGPFWIEGAEPGDTLAIHLVDLTPGADLGCVDADPVLRRPHQHPGQPDAAGRAARAHLDLRIRRGHTDTLGFSAQGSDFEVRPARQPDARHGRRGARAPRGAQLAGPRRVRRQHGHSRNGFGRNLLSAGQRRRCTVLAG